MDYYNTNYLRGGDLHNAQLKAKTQAEKVLEFFKAYPNDFIKAEIVNAVVLPGCHRGTVSRCLRVLVLDEELIKCSHFQVSGASTKVHTWRLAPEDTKGPVQTALF